MPANTSEKAKRKVLLAYDRRYDEVLDLDAGLPITLQEFLGGGDYGDLIAKKRVALENDLVEGKARYVCPWCREPMALRSIATQDKTEERFFFKHRYDTGECSGKKGLSPAAICARKFANSKEGVAHKRFKRWLEESIGADPRFSATRTEARVIDIDGVKWRQPDVQSRWMGQLVAFEVQLSTTFLHVIAERMRFYRRNKGRLLWVFRDLDPDAFKLAEDDIFYSNNRNGFLVNETTVALSIEQQRLALECAWVEPRLEGDGVVAGVLRRKVVFFDELTFDVSLSGVPRAYYFDYDGALEALGRQREAEAKASAEARDQSLRADLEALMLNFIRDEDGGPSWQALRRRYRERGFELPDRLYGNGPFYLLQAAYSAKHGKPVACRIANLMGLAQSLFNRHKDTLWALSVMLGHFDRANDLTRNGDLQSWKNHRDEYRQGWLDGDPRYQPNRRYDDLLAFLFPGAAEALRQSPTQVEAARRAKRKLTSG